MSDYTRTPNYQLYKPTPDADSDAWGGHLNANADTIDSVLGGLTGVAGGPWLPLSGGNVNGTVQARVFTTGSNTWTPANTALQPIIDSRGNLAGVVNGVATLNRITVSNDTMDASLGQNACFADFSIYHNVAGATVKGGRQTIWSQLNVGALTTPSLQMNGIQSSIFVTGNTNSAWCQPFSTTVQVLNGGSAGSTGCELLIGAMAGSSVGDKYFLQFTYLPGDAVAGGAPSNDAMLRFVNVNPAGTAPGASIIFGLGGPGAGFPVNPSGSIMSRITQTANQGSGRNYHFIAPQCAYGIDLSGVNFTANAFRSGGFSVDGAGQVQMANATLGTAANGVTLDVPRQIVTAAAVAAGGGGGGSGINDYYVGDILFASSGGQYRVATVTAGAVSSVAVLVPGTTGAPPTNPVATTGGSGVNCTLNLTWSAGTLNGLSLNPTGQRIGFNGTAPVAKPTVTGAKGSNAALGSLLSALASYGLITDSSTA